MCRDEMDTMQDVCDDLNDLNEEYVQNLQTVEDAYGRAYSSNVKGQLILRAG